MLKMVLGALAATVALFLALPMFLAPSFQMSRSVEINAPVAVVYQKLADLHTFDKWNPFPEGDSTNRTVISGEGLGSSLSWTGEQTGEGKMTIVKLEPNQKIDIKMEFFKPISGEAMVYWIAKPTGDSSTEMTWAFEQELSYFKRYLGLMMEAMMSAHYEKGLLKLKALVESGA